MSWVRVKTILKQTYLSCMRHDQLNNAAALAFYFLLSLCPLMIFLVSLVALFPISDLESQIIDSLAQIVPADAMKILDRVLLSIFQTDPRLLSLGIVGAIFAGSSGFNATISAVNSAYEVQEVRPIWKKQLIALLLTILVGAMLLAAVSLSVLGSKIGLWLAMQLGLHSQVVRAWPCIRWLIVVIFSAVSLEVVYCVAPHLEQSVLAQIPGAAFAVVLWLVSSCVLGIYFSHFSQYASVYGTLGATIALLLWFYFSSLAVLVGAEVNAQMQKTAR